MHPTVDNSEMVFSSPFFNVFRYTAQFNTFKKIYDVINFGPRVGVVLQSSDSFLLTRQYRFLIDDFSWEIPGGKVEVGETEIEAAKRECFEETGFSCKTLNPLTVFYPGLDNVQNRTTVFSCDSFDDERMFSPDPSEVIELKWFSRSDCLKMIRNNVILDSLTINGILSAVAFTEERYA